MAGERCRIAANAWTNAEFGDDCAIDFGAIVGKMPHAGWTARPVAPQEKARIGNHVLVGCYAVVYAGATVGDDCLIGDLVTIREGCTIGRGVRLASHVSVNYDTTIGDGTVVMQATHLTGRMTIGRNCFIGPLVVTMNHREPRDGFVDRDVIGPTIGDGVLIGGGAIILPGITIGDGATIAAGAIVTKNVPPGALVVGQPARMLPPSPPAAIPFSICPRCGHDLNNVSPGVAVTSGGQSVCTTCARPEEIIANARAVQLEDVRGH